MTDDWNFNESVLNLTEKIGLIVGRSIGSLMMVRGKRTTDRDRRRLFSFNESLRNDSNVKLITRRRRIDGGESEK